MKYNYFVSYRAENGYGNAEIKTGNKIKSIEDIQKIEKKLSDDFGIELKILHFQLFGRSWK